MKQGLLSWDHRHSGGHDVLPFEPSWGVLCPWLFEAVGTEYGILN